MPTEELYGAYNFLLEIDGVAVGAFQAVEAKPPPPGTAQPDPRTRSSPFAHKVSPFAHKVNPAAAKKIPGRLKWSDITLKRGLTSQPDSGARIPGRLKWQPAAVKRTQGWSGPHPEIQHKVNTGQNSLDSLAVKRQPVSLALKGFKPSRNKASIGFPDVCKPGRILLKNSQGATVAKWNFENAWPSKISGPEHKSDSDAAMEELVIVVERIERG